MFIGNAATLSFYQITRRVMAHTTGDASSVDAKSSLPCATAEVPSKQRPSVHLTSATLLSSQLSHMHTLISWYLRATNSVANLFDELELRTKLYQWSQLVPGEQEQAQHVATSAVLYLVLAIGAQGCPEDLDGEAEEYFARGKSLTLSYMEEPTIYAIEAHILIVVYLLGAARQRAASMYLGTAVQAAYELGIHRLDLNRLYDGPEFTRRERVWRALRILDLFLAASLGRIPSTHETRNTEASALYSASNDLCTIFHFILTQVYACRKVSASTVEQVRQYHRRWARRYSQGLRNDDIQLGEELVSGQGTPTANVNFFTLMIAYYWTVMLITRPSLINSTSQYRSTVSPKTDISVSPTSYPPTQSAMARACVDSAIQTVDLMSRLLSADGVPKRLPVMVNCIFVAALVLGLAQFGDLDCTYPLRDKLEGARLQLFKFSLNDDVAKGHLTMIEEIRSACEKYRGDRERRKLERQSLAFSKLFGMVNYYLKNREAPLRPTAADGGSQRGGSLPLVQPESGFDGHGSNSMDVVHLAQPSTDVTDSTLGMSITPPKTSEDMTMPLDWRRMLRDEAWNFTVPCLGELGSPAVDEFLDLSALVELET
jgi:hypothetical protein